MQEARGGRGAGDKRFPERPFLLLVEKSDVPSFEQVAKISSRSNVATRLVGHGRFEGKWKGDEMIRDVGPKSLVLRRLENFKWLKEGGGEF